MKTVLLTISLLFLIALGLYAQDNPGFNYQAVARDADNQPLANQSLTVRFSILKNSNGSCSGEIVYQEEHDAHTTALGLFNLTIGKGHATGWGFWGHRLGRLCLLPLRGNGYPGGRAASNLWGPVP